MEKSDVMVFEQPAELNRILRPPALKFARIWEQATNPLFVALLLVGTVGICLIAYWAGGLPVKPMVFGVCLVFGGQGISAWAYEKWQSRSTRSVQIDEKGLELKPEGDGKITWQRIARFQFEPAGPQLEYDKLTVRYRSADKLFEVPWSMILEEAQCEAMLSCLEKRRTTNSEEFTVEFLKEPARQEPGERFTRFWLGAFGFALYLYGIWALVSGFLHLRDHAGGGAVHFSVSSLFTWHSPFARARDFDWFLLQVGVVLIAAGVAWGWLAKGLIRKANKAKRLGARKKIEAAGGTIEIE